MMMANETFHRVPTLRQAGERSAIRTARRNQASGSRVPEAGRRQPASAWPETWLKEKTEGAYAFGFRPRGDRNLEYRLRSFIPLRRQFRIRQALANELRTQTAHAVCVIQGIVFRSTVVVSEHLLIYVPLKMERLDGNVCSVQSTLEATPKILYAVDVNATAHVALSLVNHVMHKAPLHSVAINNGIIGVYGRAVLYLLENFGLQGFPRHIRHDLRPYLPSSAVEDALHDCLAGCAALRFVSNGAVTVHILLTSTNESLIYFDFVPVTAALRHAPVAVIFLHAKTDAMQHEPSGLLRDAQSAVNLPRANAVLAVRNHPHHRQPLLKTERRFLKNGSSLDAELRLRMAGLALPVTPRRNERRIGAPTRRTDHAMRPAPRLEVVQAVVGILKVRDCLGESLGFGCHDSNNGTSVLRSQVYSCPQKPLIPRI